MIGSRDAKLDRRLAFLLWFCRCGKWNIRNQFFTVPTPIVNYSTIYGYDI